MVLNRAWAAGVEKIMVTAGQVSEVKEALELVERFDPDGQRLFTTVGMSCRVTPERDMSTESSLSWNPQK